MTHAQRSSIRAPSSQVLLAKVLRPQSSALHLGIGERKLRRLESLPASLSFRSNGQPGRTAIHHFLAQHAGETEIHPAEFLCVEFQSSSDRSPDRSTRAAAILT